MDPRCGCQSTRQGLSPLFFKPSAWWMWLAIMALSTCAATAGADAGEHSEDRKQLRALMTEVEAGINAQSADRLTALMSDDVTVTWLNAEVSRGKDEVKAYYGRMVGGEEAILNKYLTKVTLGAPARFYGEVAVAEGTAADEFFPRARDVFRLDSRWSSTMRKVDGQWRIVTLHLSTNVFTNPLMAEATRWIWFAGGGGACAGGLLVFLLLRRRRH